MYPILFPTKLRIGAPKVRKLADVTRSHQREGSDTLMTIHKMTETPTAAHPGVPGGHESVFRYPFTLRILFHRGKT